MTLPGLNTIELQCELGVTKCTVTSCPNFYETDNPDKSELYFLEFPKDYESCSLWRQRCGVGENYPITNPRICANHFRLEDYVNYTRKKLKVDAIPKLKLDWMLGAPTVVLTQSSDGKIEAQGQDATLKTIMVLSGKVKPVPAENVFPAIQDIQKAVDQNEVLRERLSDLQKEYFTIKNKTEYYEKKLRTTTYELQKTNNLINDKDKTRKRNGTLISRVFSPAQVNVLLGKKKVVWSYDDMAMAFTLRHMDIITMIAEGNDEFIPTRGSLLRKNAREEFQSVKFESYQKKNPSLTQKSVNNLGDGIKVNEFNIKKAKHEVVKYGMSGFTPQKKEEAKIQLAIKLGAKPPKNKYKNYKELLKEKTIEKKTESDRLVYEQLGKNNAGKSTAKGKRFDRNRKKVKEGLLDVYGKVKIPN